MNDVVEQMKNAILIGALKPGERIIEASIAQEMGISRYPVREAILHLENAGLLYTIPYKGTYISTIDEEELEEIYQLRSALEELSVRLLVDRADDKDIKKLEIIIKEMEHADKNNDLSSLVNADIDFHLTICELSGHRKLKEIWQNLQDQITLYMQREKYSYVRSRLKDFTHTHGMIIEALQARDKKLAELRIRNHINEALNYIKNFQKEVGANKEKISGKVNA
jgi:DNA-binding GntR family transcriptional regulator